MQSVDYTVEAKAAYSRVIHRYVDVRSAYPVGSMLRAGSPSAGALIAV